MKNKLILLLGLCIMLILSTTLSYADLNDGLIAYYNMSDGNDSVGSYHMTTIDGVTFNSTAKRGVAGHYDGNDYMESTVNHPFIGTGAEKPRTLNVWVNPIVNSPIGSIYESGTDSNDAEWGVLMGFSSDSYLLDLWGANAAVEIILYETVMLTAFSNSTDNCIMVNADEDLLTCNTRGIDTGSSTIRIGRRISSYGQYYKGMIDELGLWNRTLTDSEITDLYNNGDGYFYPFTTEDELDAYLLNDSYDRINNTLDQFRDHFYIRANYTNSGSPILGANCTYFAPQINHRFATTNGNFTLDDTNEVSLNASHDSFNLNRDVILFRSCRDQIPTADIEIYINDMVTPYSTVSGAIIPPCAGGGFHEEILVTTAFNDSDDVNISLQCSGCSAVRTHTILNIEPPSVKEGTISNLILARDHFNYTDELDYNSSTLTYDDIDALHSYSTAGDTYINVTCNDTTEQIEIFVNSLVPAVELGHIETDEQFYLFVNNSTIVEASDNIEIVGNCFGAIIDTKLINVTDESGVLVGEQSDTNISLTSTELNESKTYIVNLACSNNGNTTLLSQSFVYNDTTNPVITWTTPLDDGSTDFTWNVTSTVDLTFDDPNLFGYEVLIYDDTWTTLYYNWTDTDLDVTTYNLLETVIFNTTGNYSINITVSDDHTLNAIEDYKYSINDTDNKKLTFDFENVVEYERIPVPVTIEYAGVRTIEDVSLTKLTDRYTFDYTFKDSLVAGFNDKYIVTCENIIFRDKSDYVAHFVCPESKNWVDFENMNVETFYVKKLSNDSYEVELEYYNDAVREIAFNSIGGINIISEQSTFSVSMPSPVYSFFFDFDFDNIAHVMLLGFLIILFIGSYVLYKIYKNTIFGLMACIVGLTIGSVFLLINAWLGIIMVILSFLILFF